MKHLHFFKLCVLVVGFGLVGALPVWAGGASETRSDQPRSLSGRAFVDVRAQANPTFQRQAFDNYSSSYVAHFAGGTFTVNAQEGTVVFKATTTLEGTRVFKRDEVLIGESLVTVYEFQAQTSEPLVQGAAIDVSLALESAVPDAFLRLLRSALSKSGLASGRYMVQSCELNQGVVRMRVIVAK